MNRIMKVRTQIWLFLAGALLANPLSLYLWTQETALFEKGLPAATVAMLLCLLFAQALHRSRASLPAVLRSQARWFVILLLVLLLLHFVVTPLFYARLKLPRTLYLLGLCWFVLYGFYHHVVSRPGGRRGPVTLAFVMLELFLLAEAACIWPARTHGHAPNFANLNWYYRYGGPVNEWGVRDYPHPAGGKPRKTLLMTGDSFLMGAGVPDIADRFSSVTARALGEGTEVINLGKGGAESRSEYTDLEAFPRKADGLVLSWLPNDIWMAAVQSGKDYDHPAPMSQSWTLLRLAVQHSYALNYLYYSFPHNDFPDYSDHLKACFADTEIMAQHLMDLSRFVTWAGEREIPMVVVVWPFLQDMAGSQYATAPVISFFRDQHIPVVAAETVLSGKPGSEWTVNMNDAHPNEAAHARVGQALADTLRAYGWN